VSRVKGSLRILVAALGVVAILAGCSPAAQPKGHHKGNMASSVKKAAHSAKTAGKHGKKAVGSAARSITKGTKRLPAKAKHGAKKLAKEGKHTAAKFGVGPNKLGWKGHGGSVAGKGGLMALGGTGAPAGLKVIGFVTSDNTQGPNGSPGLDLLAKTPQAVTYLSPLFYSVNADGSITSHYVAGVVSFARSHGIKVMPLVNNANTNHAFLENPTARKTAVANLVSIITSKNFDGVSIDFQGLPSTSRIPLDIFMDELSARLHPLGKTITINLIPTEAQTGEHGAYDEHTLARYSDQLILMTYDRHDDSSAPGPVSPHRWVVQALEHAIRREGVPPQKIYLGVNTPWKVL
jgi:hypothetical protein